jgi:KDO2-lipid IV(A) lauroyltransferase
MDLHSSQNQNSNGFLYEFLSPKFWPMWLNITLIATVARFPFKIALQIGAILGWFSLKLGRRRRNICNVNLKLCFPNLNQHQLNELMRATFRENGIGLVEAAIAWTCKIDNLKTPVEIEGLHFLQAAQSEGNGVLLVGAHYSTLEMGGALLAKFTDLDVTYRKHKNLLFDRFMHNSRSKHYTNVIEREDVRKIARSLRNGNTVWFAPDQDYGKTHSVFAPFFGVEAATIKATARFARLNNSPTLIFSHHRKKDNSGYILKISPRLVAYPTDDEYSNALKINHCLEARILEFPAQYLWLHRRFKTQPTSLSGEIYNTTNEILQRNK